jgi:hypothetical protein
MTNDMNILCLACSQIYNNTTWFVDNNYLHVEMRGIVEVINTYRFRKCICTIQINSLHLYWGAIAIWFHTMVKIYTDRWHPLSLLIYLSIEYFIYCSHIFLPDQNLWKKDRKGFFTFSKCSEKRNIIYVILATCEG